MSFTKPYYSKQELQENSDLNEVVISLNRQELQAKGFVVEANKKKKSPLKRKEQQDLDYFYSNDDPGNNQIGSDFESHPELPYMGGKPSDQPILPENAVDAVDEAFLSQEQKTKKAEKRKRERERRQELANRLNKKFKMNAPAPKQQPKYRPAERPRSAPPKLRPPGS